MTRSIEPAAAASPAPRCSLVLGVRRVRLQCRRSRGVERAGPARAVLAASRRSSHSAGKPAPPLRAADVQQIKHAYETFFDGKTPVSTSETVLQNGAKLKATLVAQAKSPTAQALSAKVTKVTRAPGNANPNVAQAMFSLLPERPSVTSGHAWLCRARPRNVEGLGCDVLPIAAVAAERSEAVQPGRDHGLPDGMTGLLPN